MRPIVFRSLALSSATVAFLLAASGLPSARRPRSGGTLRVEMQAAVASLDPADWPADSASADAKEKLLALAFETLTHLDEKGQAQPALAVSWNHDAAFQRWEFRLRPNVRFHDGAPLATETVAQILAASNAKWRVTSAGSAIVIEVDSPAPDMPALLASARQSVFRRGAKGSLLGTGPFQIKEWQPGRRAVFLAFADGGEARPYLDSIEVQLGRALRDQSIDLGVGRADLIEISPEQVRRAAERGVRVWTSPPIELLALAFVPERPAAEDARLREALARSIDRRALVNFVLQKQGEPAGALLPQWLSGYAFLLSSDPDVGRARELVAQIVPVPRPIVLGYDAGDPLEQAVAERIAVNARDAKIIVTPQSSTSAAPVNARDAKIIVTPQSSTSAAPVDARLLRLGIRSLDPRTALASLLGGLAPFDAADAAPLAAPAASGALYDELYASERAATESFRVIPLAHLPAAYGISSRVRDWMPTRKGEWRLADLWLDASAGDAP